MSQALGWGIIGTGAIARDFATALRESTKGRVVDVVGSSPAKARAFADQWNVGVWSRSIEELLANREVDAVYVATPHPAHEAQALACVAAHKHVLCEKPITTDADSAARVVAAARREGVFLMEAYMYRCHPLMKELTARLSDGLIGAIRHVRADFGFRVTGPREGRLFEPALGGGSILDIGGYPVSFARLVAGIAERAPFAEPVEVRGSGTIGPTGVDELATAELVFASGFTAEVTSAVRHDIGTTAIVFGEEGRIVLPNPWLPRGQRHGLETELIVHRDGRAPETIPVRTRESTYAIEAALVCDTLPKLEAASPAISWADTLGNMRVLDRWQAEVARISKGANR